MSAPVLSVRGLSLGYGGAPVARDIGFDLHAGETLALVGLSGCGKTTVLRALLGLVPRRAQVAGRLATPSGAIALDDHGALRARLGRDIGFVAQNPFDACAPLRSVRAHLEEAWRAHGLPPDPARIAALCARLSLDPAMLERFPHEWSGGMLQRANIAAAIALDPPVLLADEPTSAVDADNADAVMDCLRDRSRGVLVVSHDLPLVAGCADRVLLLEGGRIVAEATGRDLARGAAPPALLRFADIGQVCRPPPPRGAPVLEVADLGLSRGGRPIVSGLGFSLRAGEILGVAGPSGAGKSTLLAALAGRLAPDTGAILRQGVARPPRKGEVLPLFQDALSSMNARWPLSRIVAEPLSVAPTTVPRRDRPAAARRALGAFGLGHVDPATLPGQLSMGQAQRVTLARAGFARPALVLADEPTSALDPRQKAAALAGLARLAEAGAAVVLVSHDRALLAGFCHGIVDLGGAARTKGRAAGATA